MPNPTDSAYVLRDLFAQLAQLKRDVLALGTTRRVTVEVATVTVYTALSSSCTVEYAGGETRVLPFVTTYTPVVGNVVTVINSPAKSFVCGEISA